MFELIKITKELGPFLCMLQSMILSFLAEGSLISSVLFS